MKITNKSPNIMKFENVHEGEVVYYECDGGTGYYLVIIPSTTKIGDDINTVRLDNGEGYWIDPEDRVVVVSAELIITSR